MHYDVMLSWQGKGFGEPLVLATLTNVLVDNELNAAWSPRGKAKDWMVDCPIFRKGKDTFDRKFRGTYELNGVPIVLQHLKTLENITGRQLNVKRSLCVPTHFETQEVPEVDVLICSETGDWTPYKNWPYFKQLKAMLNKEDITWADIHEESLWGMTCLNYAKKCKVYLGLDTGVSHYVSRFTNNKTLIIQSGFVSFDFWAHQYSFDRIEIDLPCSPCYINKIDIANGKECELDNVCMKTITPEMVFERLQKCLE